MNPSLQDARGRTVPQGTLHVQRSIFLQNETHYERLRFTNYGTEPIEIELHFSFEADFADLFEVRGTQRERRGKRARPQVFEDHVLLEYKGLDGLVRKTRLDFGPGMRSEREGEVIIPLTIEAKAVCTRMVTISSEQGKASEVFSFDEALRRTEREFRDLGERACEIHSSNELFNLWVQRSLSDMRMMVTEKETGHYPYAGIPWFSTSFGRDGIITALEMLWVAPDLAKGVLSFLAKEQALELDPSRDAEPGKILHESRGGEMANLGEIPFGRYYGSIDSTPLFVLLAADYLSVTDDRETLAQLWPAIERALLWIDRYGDRDGDGFVEYARQTEMGLEQQGWKDSHDSVFHADGSPARGSIALCEVQGYVYAAKLGASRIAEALQLPHLPERLRSEAEELRERFDKAFWSEELGTYALALDGAKRPCLVRTSNAGHCLYTGIALPERAPLLAEQLLSTEMFSGWGVRTLAANEVRYNPMAYHNGSVWPHDNALIAEGLARYGLKQHALRIMDGMFQVSLFVELHRLPELFCGFDRQSGESPTLYPVACAPQAWAAATVCSFLRACLGLQINARKQQLEFCQPFLPDFIEDLQIKRLRVGAAQLNVDLRRYADDVAVHVLSKDHDVRVAILK